MRKAAQRVSKTCLRCGFRFVIVVCTIYTGKDLYEFSASAKTTAAQKLAADGLVGEDLSTINNGNLMGFSLLGEASMAYNLIDKIELEVGRV